MIASVSSTEGRYGIHRKDKLIRSLHVPGADTRPGSCGHHESVYWQEFAAHWRDGARARRPPLRAGLVCISWTNLVVFGCSENRSDPGTRGIHSATTKHSAAPELNPDF